MPSALHLWAWRIAWLTTQSQERAEVFPTWDRAHPDAAVPARDNALLAQGHHTLLGPTTRPGSPWRSSDRCFKSEAADSAPKACATGDAGDGRWEPDGGLAPGYRWRPASCRLRYATARQLRCVLASKRIAMVGDSLVRNLFDGLAHHAGLAVVAGTGYGKLAKQHDAYAMAAADDTLVQLHWAPCAAHANSAEPPGLSEFGRVQWADCQAAATISHASASDSASSGVGRRDSLPARPRELGDILRGFGVRRDRSRLDVDGSSRCPVSQSQCVREFSTAAAGAQDGMALCAEQLQPLSPLLAVAAAAQGAANNISCVVGYGADRGAESPRYQYVPGQHLSGIEWSCWRQFCEPPAVLSPPNAERPLSLSLSLSRSLSLCLSLSLSLSCSFSARVSRA